MLEYVLEDKSQVEFMNLRLCYLFHEFCGCIVEFWL